MPDVKTLITLEAREALRLTIREAGENEVFFLAYTNEDGIVDEVAPLARGNDRSVPALLQVARQGDVILHNHPSGALTPSNADVNLASEYGNRGVGFYILNNQVDQVYVVVAAFRKEKHIPLEIPALVRILSPRGPIARKLKGYESRAEQARMLQAAAAAFNESRLALIEAGTGTGKSLAYLLPSIYWAVQNKQRVVISTNTINLQEQLIEKDIPFLKSVLDLDFKAVLVKGRNNYVCLQKVSSLKREGDLLIETEERAEIQMLLHWAGKTQDGSRADLGILPRGAVWEKVACESDNCARIKCEFYGSCFFYRARREAAAADLLVANHHLLFADLALRGVTGDYCQTIILPGYHRMVLDEAHNVEAVATDYFGSQIAKSGFRRLLARFYSLREKEKIRERGLLPFLLNKLQHQEFSVDLSFYSRIHDHVENTLIPQRENLGYLAEQVFDGIVQYLESVSPGQRQELKVRLTPSLKKNPAWESSVLTPVGQLIREIQDFFHQLVTLQGWLEDLPDQVHANLANQLVEYEALLSRLETAALTLSSVFSLEEDGQVRWVESFTGRAGRNVTFRQAPLEIAELLRTRVFEKFDTVLMTSATLTTEGRFDYIKQRLGLVGFAPARLCELMLASSFDYRSQVILGILNSLPAPDEPEFGAELSRVVLKSILASGGRALVLFTSYSLLQKVHNSLADTLRAMGIRPLRQGEGPRHRLTQIFKEDKTSVLFATDSFWEGVDVSGDALENVILTKLPFSVPREPIIQARVEAIEQRGGNAFLEYSVPQAVIKFKQGFGRLIRSKSDRGSIMIFDRRILEKQYGKIFLHSLPECRQVTGTEETVFTAVEGFFARRTPAPHQNAPESRKL